MTRADAGAGLWLRYVEDCGGLWEDAGETTIVVLPEALQKEYRHPDELRVTTNPDVAREDGASLLFAGHPWLMQAAESVLGTGDCGLVRLPRPAAPPPDSGQLLAAARERFPVEHGRIDATGGAVPSLRLVLRVGTLVTFAVSSDVTFQEQVECWVDVPSCLEVPHDVAARLSRLVDVDHEERAMAPPQAADLLAAVRYAQQRIDERAREREAELSKQVSDEHGRELERAVAYYQEAVRSLQRRLAAATPERASTLAAKMASTHAERDRRLAEITEKYRATHRIRPFRLHGLGVPTLRLPVDVRRGERRYPLTVDWLLPTRTFAPLRCPVCGGTAPLVAAKTGLGCRDCLIGPDLPPPPAPSIREAPAPKPTETPSPNPPTPPPPARTSSPRPTHAAAATTGPARTQQAIQKAGRKLAATLWDLAVAGDRRIHRLYAPHSPAITMHVLFGTGAPMRAIGIDGGEVPLAMSWSPSRAARPDSDLLLVDGQVRTASMMYGHQLCWRFTGGTALIEELTPFDGAFWPRQPEPRYYPGGPAARRLYGHIAPQADLDPVASTLWRHSMLRHGLPLTLRALAAWWRLEERERLLAAHPAQTLAAALDRIIAYRAGLSARYEDAATAYQVPVAAARVAAGDLQRQLRLSANQPW